VGNSEEPTGLLDKYLYQRVVVVEVQNGESQEEAWRHHLLTNPGDDTVYIKIFHYLLSTSPLNRV
jgi:hypothetical protein